jgi:hypothetical protein
MNNEERETFMGTYFDKTIVLRLSSAARLFSWIIAGFYSVQWLIQVGTFIIQSTRGFWIGMDFSNIAQNILWLFEQPLRGLVYFIVLQCVAQVLLLLMDMEDNTRRAVRGIKKK